MLPPMEPLYSCEDFFNRFYKWLSSREDGYFFPKMGCRRYYAFSETRNLEPFAA